MQTRQSFIRQESRDQCVKKDILSSTMVFLMWSLFGKRLSVSLQSIRIELQYFRKPFPASWWWKKPVKAAALSPLLLSCVRTASNGAAGWEWEGGRGRWGNGQLIFGGGGEKKKERSSIMMRHKLKIPFFSFQKCSLEKIFFCILYSFWKICSEQSRRGKVWEDIKSVLQNSNKTRKKSTHLSTRSKRRFIPR